MLKRMRPTDEPVLSPKAAHSGNDSRLAAEIAAMFRPVVELPVGVREKAAQPLGNDPPER
jgi:hypothetical protein